MTQKDGQGNVIIPEKLYDQMGGELHDARAFINAVKYIMDRNATPQQVYDRFKLEYEKFERYRMQRHQRLYPPGT